MRKRLEVQTNFRRVLEPPPALIICLFPFVRLSPDAALEIAARKAIRVATETYFMLPWTVLERRSPRHGSRRSRVWGWRACLRATTVSDCEGDRITRCSVFGVPLLHKSELPLLREITRVSPRNFATLREIAMNSRAIMETLSPDLCNISRRSPYYLENSSPDAKFDHGPRIALGALAPLGCLR